MLTDHQKAQRRAAYAANPSPYIEKARNWAHLNRDRRREICAEWYHRNKDSQLAYSRAYRATEHGRAVVQRANRQRRTSNPELWAINMAKKALSRRTGLPVSHLAAAVIEAEIARLAVLKLCRALAEAGK